MISNNLSLSLELSLSAKNIKEVFNNFSFATKVLYEITLCKGVPYIDNSKITIIPRGCDPKVFNKDNPESPTAFIPDNDEPALLPFVAKMNDTLLEFSEEPKEVQILDEFGNLLLAGDNDRRFFEAAWLHKYNGKYYFSYSTGDTHYICYGVGDNPYGPFHYKGRILNPVVGWTSHHSICKIDGKSYLFYHDSSLSKGCLLYTSPSPRDRG